MRFEWDPEKNEENQRKHGIPFEEGQTVFYDDNAIFLADPDHSEHEERFLMLGFSSTFRILVVCHCYRKAESVVRLISVRKATRHERAQYGERLL
jgi:uncharacterized DUF497 family protein